MSISGTVKSIQDIMRQDAGVDGDAQRISQLAWMFFLKIFDDREQERQAILELEDKPYSSPIPERFRWAEWAADTEGITGDALLDFINNDLFPTLKDLDASDGDRRSFVVREAFSDAYNYMKSGTLLRQVINKINGIDFNKREDQHLFGDIYEQILRDLQSAGNAGEFYTPRAVTQFMVDMVDPKLGEVVLDPACGTGGFLTNTIDHVNEKYVKSASDWDVLQESVRGVEKKQLPHLLAVTNLMLHGIDVPDQVRHDNTLTRPYASYSQTDQVDVILTNPPFGGTEEGGIENNFPSSFRTRETADLFLTLILRLLKDGGRAAVVLPDGFLFGEGVKTRIKERVLDECDLHTIVRLPPGVFSPYTGITTNLLFFTKGAPTQEIWFFEHPYPNGSKSYSKTKPIDIAEFVAEKEWWPKRKEGPLSWRVSVDDVRRRRFNLDYRNPSTGAGASTPISSIYGEYARRKATADAAVEELIAALTSAPTTRTDQLVSALRADVSLMRFDDAPRGVRHYLLGLAFKGKLVEHSTTNSSELLPKLHDAKREFGRGKRVDEGFCRVEPHEVDFPIPDHWSWCRLSDVGQIVGGGTPKTTNPDYFSDDGIPWLTPADLYDLREKTIRRGKRDISELGLQKSSARLLPAGTVLFSSRAPIGYVAIAGSNIATNQGFKSCIPFLMQMNHYIYYYLKFAAKRIDQAASGTTFKEVSGRKLGQFPIPVPPLDEQAALVKRLDSLMATCNKVVDALAVENKSGVNLVERLLAE